MNPQDINIEPVLEAILVNQNEGMDEMNKNLEAIIVQNEENKLEPILENMIIQNDESQKILTDINNSIKEKNVTPKIEIEVDGATIEVVEGAKGDKGDTGAEPTDERLISLIEPLIPEPKNGIDGKDGVSVDKKEVVSDILDIVLQEIPTVEEIVSQIPVPKDGLNGKDANEDEIVKTILEIIPKPKNGKDGKNGSSDTGKQIVTKLKSLKKGERLSYDDLDDTPTIFKGSSKTTSLVELDDVDYSGLSLVNGKYVLGSGSGGGGTWGSITGTITDQTDLVDYVADQLATQNDLQEITNNGATTTVQSTFSGGLITPTLKATTSAGTLFESNSGTDVALFGTGGGAGATFYGGVNLNDGTQNIIELSQANAEIRFPFKASVPFASNVNFGDYSSVGSLRQGAGFYMGTGVKTANGTANALVKFSGETGHFFYTRYDRGLEFHVSITGAAGAIIPDTTGLVARFTPSNRFAIGSNCASEPTAHVSIETMSTSIPALQTKLIASQTGALYRWLDSSANVLGEINYQGRMSIGNVVDVNAGALLQVRGSGATGTNTPLFLLQNTTDDTSGKNLGILTRSRMSSRYLQTYQTGGQNDNSFGNPGLVNWTALEFTNNIYTAIATPTEFRGWNYQYYNGSVYKQALRVGTAGVGINLPSIANNPLAMLDIYGTTEQLRLNYDASNRMSVTVGSTGSTTFALTGTAPTFIFSQSAAFNAGIVPSHIQGGNTSTSTSVADAQYLGSTNTTYQWRTGSPAPTLAADVNWTSANFLSQTITEGASGTHALIANTTIGALSITNGAATTTNAATLYIEGAATGTATPTNNYAVWVDDGTVRIDGDIENKTQTLTDNSIKVASTAFVQGNKIGYPLQFVTTQGYAMNDSTTLFCNGFLMGSVYSGGVVVPKTGTIKSVYITVRVTGTLASSEDIPIYIRINDTTDVFLTNTKYDAASQSYTITGLSTSVTAGDSIALKWINPVLATNPTGNQLSATMYIE